MAQDDIVQRIVVEGADQAVHAFSLIENGATHALGGISQMAQGLVGSLGATGIAISTVVGAATGLVGILESITQHASDSAAAIRGLAIISGSSVEDMSALVSAFSAAGVGTEALVTAFRRLSTTVSTEMPKVRKEMESAADTIAGANLKVGDAQLALIKAQGGFVSAAVESAQKIKSAQLALSEATRAAAEASANDIRKFVRYFDDLANGVQTKTKDMNLSLENLRKGIVGSIGSAVTVEALKDFQGSIHDIGDPAMQTMLLKLADIFKNMPDGIQKTALAVQLFGRSAGPGLIAFLNQGSAAIVAAKQHVKDLGLELTTAESGALKRFRIANFELADVLDRLKEKFAATIAPEFTERLEQVRHYLEEHPELWRALAEAAKAALEATFRLLGQIKTAILDVKSAWSAAVEAFQTSDVKSFLDPVVDKLRMVIDLMNIAVAIGRSFGKTLGESDASVKDSIASIIGLTDKTREAGLALLKAFTSGKISAAEYSQQLKELQKSTEEVGATTKKVEEANLNVGAAAKKSGQDQVWANNAAARSADDVSYALGGVIDKYQKAAQAARDAAIAARATELEKTRDPMTGQLGIEAYDPGNRYASGGLISGPGGPTSDSILARLSSGEFVMRTAAVQHWGAPLLHMLNNLTVPRFATGGMVAPRQSPIVSTASTGQRVLNLTIEGRAFHGLTAPENTAQALERFAVHSQIASAGRRPSWRR